MKRFLLLLLLFLLPAAGCSPTSAGAFMGRFNIDRESADLLDAFWAQMTPEERWTYVYDFDSPGERARYLRRAVLDPARPAFAGLTVDAPYGEVWCAAFSEFEAVMGGRYWYMGRVRPAYQPTYPVSFPLDLADRERGVLLAHYRLLDELQQEAAGRTGYLRRMDNGDYLLQKEKGKKRYRAPMYKLLLTVNKEGEGARVRIVSSYASAQRDALIALAVGGKDAPVRGELFRQLKAMRKGEHPFLPLTTLDDILYSIRQRAEAGGCRSKGWESIEAWREVEAGLSGGEEKEGGQLTALDKPGAKAPSPTKRTELVDRLAELELITPEEGKTRREEITLGAGAPDEPPDFAAVRRELERLRLMHEKGLIGDGEYATRKWRILSGL